MTTEIVRKNHDKIQIVTKRKWQQYTKCNKTLNMDQTQNVRELQLRQNYNRQKLKLFIKNPAYGRH